jgi:DNA-binding MarR family transcriptional regulator
MTGKQALIYSTLINMGDRHPTVRSLADRLEERQHRSERWTDNEVRGLLTRLEADGRVARYSGPKGEVRWQALGSQAGETG